ncbi:hypothetical protein GX48_02404 [Paracoccidioides brasiliensis]|nr:hypothetical protein GX48_02404 [Paracoccidioides brasiliensis]
MSRPDMSMEPDARGWHKTTLLSLPNELYRQLILQILDPFPTRSLLPLSLTCRRIRDIIARLIYYRLYTLMTTVGADSTFLECYHPAFKPIGPYLKCAYLRTDALIDHGSSPHNDPTAPYQLDKSDSARFMTTEYLGRLNSSYTHFLPLCPRGSWINTNMSMAGSPRFMVEQTISPQQQLDNSYNTHIRGSIFLDENELFSQLITGVWLGRPHRQRYLLDGGVVRLWRRWLGDRDRERRREWKRMFMTGIGVGAYGGETYSAVKTGDPAYSGQIGEMVPPWEDSSVLWLGEKRAGLKFRVCHRNRGEGLQFGEESDTDSDVGEEQGEDDDNTSVRYDIEIEELLVHTTTLLLAIEKGCCK